MHGPADKGGKVYSDAGKRRKRRDVDGMDAKVRSMEAKQRTVATGVRGLWRESRSYR